MPNRRFRPARSGVAALLVGAAYAGYASGTTAFTTAADVAVALPLAAGIAGLVLWWSAWASVPRMVPGHWWPWAALAAAVLVLEGLSYLALPRSSHPTLSSISDRVMALRALKAALLFGWLWLGLLIVRPK